MEISSGFYENGEHFLDRKSLQLLWKMLQLLSERAISYRFGDFTKAESALKLRLNALGDFESAAL
jgi:hypothetical protein